MNQEDKKKIKIGITISTFTVLLYLALKNFRAVLGAFRYVYGLLIAFVIGVGAAFVLNILMKLVEKVIFEKIDYKKHPKAKKMKRPVSLIITVLIFLGILALLAFFVVQLVKSSISLSDNLTKYLASLEEFVNRFLSKWGLEADLLDTAVQLLYDFSEKIIGYIGNTIPQIVESAKNITTSVFNIIMGFIIGIYILATKEDLLLGLKKMTYAFLPTKSADYLLHVASLANKRFTGFVTGQLTEAVILGVLCFLGMSLFRMEYASIISVIIGITNIIPIVGTIIGAIPGVIILLMVDPMKALWFVVFIIVLQQIESNLIYPKVVGDSIGLPGLFVIFAIVVGGELFGFEGILLGVPTFAVIYTLVSEVVTKKLKDKKLNIK